jgi:hypothetical protein
LTDPVPPGESSAQGPVPAPAPAEAPAPDPSAVAPSPVPVPVNVPVPPPVPGLDSPPLFLRIGLWAAFATAAILGVVRVNERVKGLEDFQVDLSTAWLSRAPDWLPEPERKAFAAESASTGKVAFHDVGLPEFVAGRVDASPRVARVVAARRRHPDGVEVLVELRRPVALVEAGGRLVAVDRDGVHVPGEFRRMELPRIRGGETELPAPGEPFGRAVLEGASVAAALPADLALPLGLSTLDVSGIGKGKGVVLPKRAAKGEPPLTVEWGRAPASPEAALDPPAQAKVARLRLAARRFPGLKGLRSIRLAFDDLVVVPL